MNRRVPRRVKARVPERAEIRPGCWGSWARSWTAPDPGSRLTGSAGLGASQGGARVRIRIAHRVVAAGLLALPLVGCATQSGQSPPGEGALKGGIIGATGGGLIGAAASGGHDTGRNVGLGALIGGLVGALAGEVIQQRTASAAPAPPTPPAPAAGLPPSPPPPSPSGQWSVVTAPTPPPPVGPPAGSPAPPPDPTMGVITNGTQ